MKFIKFVIFFAIIAFCVCSLKNKIIDIESWGQLNCEIGKNEVTSFLPNSDNERRWYASSRDKKLKCRSRSSNTCETVKGCYYYRGQCLNACNGCFYVTNYNDKKFLELLKGSRPFPDKITKLYITYRKNLLKARRLLPNKICDNLKN